MPSLRGMIVLDDDAGRMVYGRDELRDIREHVELIAPPLTKAAVLGHRDLLGEAEVIFSGWGGPRLDADFLDVAKRLRLFLYAAGSLSSILTDAVWARGITVSSALNANAVPVAEYALATILFSMKHGWRLSRESRENRMFDAGARDATPGCYKSTVGLVSMGAVARKLAELLRPFDMDVIAYDPFMTSNEASRLGVRLVSLEEVFRTADVVSLHTPHLAETAGMVTGELFGSMKLGATFINTARGEVVRQDDLIEIAAARPDLQFVLDVTHPEPPPADSPLFTLPNVVLTPHIAGSAGQECLRMGRSMVEELQRYVSGSPLLWAVTPELTQFTSHRPVSKTRATSWRQEAATAS